MNIDPTKKSIYNQNANLNKEKGTFKSHLSLYSYFIFPQAEEHKKRITLTK